MELSDDRAQRSPFLHPADHSQSTARTIPILQTPVLHTPAPSPGDPMETSPSITAMGPPSNPGVESDANGAHDYMSMGDHHNGSHLSGPNAAAAAAAGAQQPKVVQTAFIHKLYK